MKIFSVFKKDLLILLRDRADMLVLFLMPLAFIIPISLALGSGDGYGVNRGESMITLTVADYDRGPRAQMLLTAMGESLRIEKELPSGLLGSLGLMEDLDCLPEEADAPTNNPICIDKAGKAMLERSWRQAVLIIPSGFSQIVDDGERATITLLYDPAGDSTAMQQIEGVVRGAAVKISLQNQLSSGMEQLNEIAVFAPQGVRSALEAQAATPQPSTIKPALRLEKVPPLNFRETVTPDTYQQTIPGYTVMFVFFIITSMTASIHAEQLSGTFRRLLSSPVSRSDLLGGKMLATVVVGLAQVFVLFAAGALIFNLQLGNDPLAFFLLTTALVSAAASIGLAVSTTRIRGGGLAAPLTIAALLGGCMFPLDLMPAFLRTLSFVVPHSWALTGYQNLMVRGLGLQEVLPQIGALALFALVFFLIAARRFDFERGGTD